MVLEVKLLWNGYCTKLDNRCLLESLKKYQRVSDLGQVDKLLIGGGAHVETYGEHLFQGSHNK